MPKSFHRGYIESWNLAVQDDLGKGIVVSPHDEYGNSGLTKPTHLLRKKPRRLHGCLVAVVKVSSD